MVTVNQEEAGLQLCDTQTHPHRINFDKLSPFYSWANLNSCLSLQSKLFPQNISVSEYVFMGSNMKVELSRQNKKKDKII